MPQNFTRFAKRCRNDSFETPALSGVPTTTGISAVTTEAMFWEGSRGGRGVRGGRGLPSFGAWVRGLPSLEDGERGLSPGRADEERDGPDLFGPPGLRAPGLLPVLLLAAASRTSL